MNGYIETPKLFKFQTIVSGIVFAMFYRSVAMSFKITQTHD